MSTVLINNNNLMNDNQQVLTLLENHSALEDQKSIKSNNDTHKEIIITEESKKKVPKLGPFLLLKTLGIGEFGKVKLGKHAETGQIVAVKLVKKQNIDSSSRLEKIRMEIDIMKTLNHPYIVKLLCVNETNTHIGMVLEYAQGGELFEYIYKQRFLREEEARRLFAQLVSCVRYMHQKNIVHRDLKLENILLDHHGNIIVTDFGFANQFSPKTGDLMSTACGSPVYAAPELVMTGRLYAGTGVDIWSCGIILFAMLSGYLPFDDDIKNPNGDNIGRLYRYIMTHKPRYPDHISKGARTLIGQMLIPDPNERCRIEDIISNPWLSEYKELMAKSVDDLEREAQLRKKSLLKGIDSTTNLNILLDERGDELVQEQVDDIVTSDESPSESCSSASSISSSYSNPPSFGDTKGVLQQDDQEKEESDQHSDKAIINAPITNIENTHLPVPLTLNGEVSEKSSSSSSSRSAPSSHDKEEEQPAHVVPLLETKKNEQPTKLLTPPEANKVDVITPSEEKPLRRQTFSLKSKFLSSIKKRHSTQDPQRPTTTVKNNSNRHSWQNILHRNNSNNTSPKERPPVVPLVTHVEASKSERILSWIKKSKSNYSKKHLLLEPTSDDPTLKTIVVQAAPIPEEEATIPIAKPTSSMNSSSRGDTLSSHPPDEEQLRIHTGNMNHSALTSKEPMSVLLEINKILLILGIEVKNMGGYKLHCVRPPVTHSNYHYEASKDPMQHLSTPCHSTTLSQPMYGHPDIDNGQEIAFTVEICRFENLSGLFSVDLQCLSENFSGYQFIGQKLLCLLHYGDIIRNTNFNV